MITATKDGIEALVEFLQKTSAFTRTGTTPSKPPTPTFENEPDPPDDEEPSYQQNDGG